MGAPPMDLAKSVDLRLQVRADAPAQGRREVGALAAGLPEDLRENLQLLVSELIANSLRHGQLTDEDWIALRARVGPTSVRVEVSDPGRSFQPPHGRDPGTPASRSGLWMLNQIATRWGMVRDTDTLVWFETDLPDGEPAAPWFEAIRGWGAEARDGALDIAKLYGPPDEFGSEGLTWRRHPAHELTLRQTEPGEQGVQGGVAAPRSVSGGV